MDRATFDKLLAMSVKRGVSDIHLQVGYPPLFRINGALLEVKIPELTPADTEEIAKFITADSLAYLSDQGLHQSVGDSLGTGRAFCDACFTGDYPVGIGSDALPVVG